MNDIDQFVFEGKEEEIEFIVTANISFEEACNLLKEKGGYIRHPEMYYPESDDEASYMPTYDVYFCVDKEFSASLCDYEFKIGPCIPAGPMEDDLPEYWHDYIGLREYLSREWSHGYYPE